MSISFRARKCYYSIKEIDVSNKASDLWHLAKMLADYVSQLHALYFDILGMPEADQAEAWCMRFPIVQGVRNQHALRAFGAEFDCEAANRALTREVHGDGKEAYVDMLRSAQDRDEAQTENARLRKLLAEMVEALQFVKAKLVTRSAGNRHSPFAYLWRRDWDAFAKQADAALDAAKEV